VSQHSAHHLFPQKMPERTVQHLYSQTIYSTVRLRNWRTSNMKKCTKRTRGLRGKHLLYLSAVIRHTKISEGKFKEKYFIQIWSNFRLYDAGEFCTVFAGKTCVLWSKKYSIFSMTVQVHENVQLPPSRK
jgi:hypothetical protein